MNYVKVKELLRTFINEDVGNGDLSADLIFPPEQTASGYFLLKADGVICGLQLAPIIYELLGGRVEFKPLVEEGSFQTKGTKIASVSGPVRTLLSGERLILNLWQRMAGIATMTKKAVDTLDDASIRICDTRKTAPGLRIFDKYAVRQGGGFNHRIGLYDGVMLKDNHIGFAGGIKNAVEKVKSQTGLMVNVEVEVETVEQLQEAIDANADIIMFDNRTPQQAKEFQSMVPDHITTEVSGGITLDNLADYKGSGVDYISLGFLTNSVQSIDISFLSSTAVKG